MGPNNSKTPSILKLQKKTIRVLNKANYNSHTDPLFKQSNILKVGDQYKYEAMILHNFLGNKLPKSFDQVFQLNRDVREVHETRQSNLIYMKRCDSEFSKSIQHTNIIYIIHALQDLHFKQSIKKALISVYLYSVRCRNPNCKDCKNTAVNNDIYIWHLKGLKLFIYFFFFYKFLVSFSIGQGIFVCAYSLMLLCPPHPLPYGSRSQSYIDFFSIGYFVFLYFLFYDLI